MGRSSTWTAGYWLRCEEAVSGQLSAVSGQRSDGAEMKDFRRLQVWQKAHLLTLKVYEATRKFPKEELYGLTTQMRKNSSSIPTNIAEGCGRGGDTEFARFLQIAMGSASELGYELILSRDLHYLSLDEYESLNQDTVEVKRMLAPFIRKLKAEC